MMIIRKGVKDIDVLGLGRTMCGQPMVAGDNTAS